MSSSEILGRCSKYCASIITTMRWSQTGFSASCMPSAWHNQDITASGVFIKNIFCLLCSYLLSRCINELLRGPNLKTISPHAWILVGCRSKVFRVVEGLNHSQAVLMGLRLKNCLLQQTVRKSLQLATRGFRIRRIRHVSGFSGKLDCKQIMSFGRHHFIRHEKTMFFSPCRSPCPRIIIIAYQCNSGGLDVA